MDKGILIIPPGTSQDIIDMAFAMLDKQGSPDIIVIDDASKISMHDLKTAVFNEPIELKEYPVPDIKSVEQDFIGKQQSPLQSIQQRHKRYKK